MSGDHVVYRVVAARETWPLRHAILRPHQSLAEMSFAGDELADTRHFGAFVGAELVGVASIYREPREGQDAGAAKRAFRLRGMATADGVRGKGHGAALVRICLEHVARAGGTELWCNARDTASGFYARLGFEQLGGPFELPGIGPHVRMRVVVTG